MGYCWHFPPSSNRHRGLKYVSSFNTRVLMALKAPWIVVLFGWAWFIGEHARAQSECFFRVARRDQYEELQFQFPSTSESICGIWVMRVHPTLYQTAQALVSLRWDGIYRGLILMRANHLLPHRWKELAPELTYWIIIRAARTSMLLSQCPTTTHTLEREWRFIWDISRGLDTSGHYGEMRENSTMCRSWSYTRFSMLEDEW